MQYELISAATECIAADVKRAEEIAYAEKAWAAANGTKQNPFDGARKNLELLQREHQRMAAECATLRREQEEQRQQQELVEHGKCLAEAVDALREATASIKRIGTEHDQCVAELQRMEMQPVVIRWGGARGVAASLGLEFSFRPWAEWWESGRDWRLGPRDVLAAAADGWVGSVVNAWANTGMNPTRAAELTMPLRFSDRDRETVIAARKQRDVVREVALRLASVRERRAELLEAFPALRSFDATADMVSA